MERQPPERGHETAASAPTPVTEQDLEEIVEHGHRPDDDVPLEAEEAALAELEYGTDETGEG